MAVDWNNVITDSASLAAVVGGLAAAASYGRKANATVAATPQRLPDGHMILSVRPSVAVSGVLAIRIKNPDMAVVAVTEVVVTPAGLADGHQWTERAVFANNLVVSGETLTSTVVFDLGEPGTTVVGWRIGLAVNARRFWGGQWSWDDRVYVPLPLAGADPGPATARPGRRAAR
ncbi:MAG: hypothetical protein ACRDY0_10830 [Acidimicrobiales bacterium]